MAVTTKTSLWMGLFFFVIGTAAMVGSVMIHRYDTAFFASATETTATVVQITRISRAHKRDRMYVRYAFDVDGEPVEGSGAWNGTTEAFRALSEGDEIRIAYLPDNDATQVRSRLITGGRTAFLVPMLIIGAVFALVGGALVVRSRRSG